MKKCNKCKQDKELCDFYTSKRNKSGYDTQCKECKQKYIKINNQKYGKEYFSTNSKKYQQLNKEKINQTQKEYYHNNKHYWIDNENRKEYCKSYTKLNRKKLNEWSVTQYKTNPQFKLGMLLRQRFKSAIKGYKISQIENLIGCSVIECKLYLEKLFLPEMSWENHGEIWEIDHIKPCVSFDLTDINQQKECFHYSNLQPLFKTTKIAQNFGYTYKIGNRNKGKST
jgi:hypothetical protein